MNVEQARFNMIEQQIRPWDVLDQSVLTLLALVKREDFVPPAYRVLEIGTGSGYMAALLAHRAQHVVTLEMHAELVAFARANLQRSGTPRVEVRQGDGARGLPEEAPFEVILLSGSVPEVPPGLLAQLKVGGRLAAIVGQLPIMRATLFTRSSEHDFASVELFDTVAPRLAGFDEPPRFKF